MKPNGQLRHNLLLIEAIALIMIKCWKMMVINGLAIFLIVECVVMQLLQS